MNNNQANISDHFDIEFLEISSDVKLRRMVLGKGKKKGVVLLLHGFPETISTWYRLAPILAESYEVHAFDWPGFGASSRPEDADFEYSAKSFGRTLGEYTQAAGLDGESLLIYGTDIGALPALIFGVENADLVSRLVVGDFAPLNRPRYMADLLQDLKSAEKGAGIRDHMNSNPTGIVHKSFQMEIPQGSSESIPIPSFVLDDMISGWGAKGITSADAFFHYYARFSRDQDYFESVSGDLKTPTKVLWGEKDTLIHKGMGEELVRLIGSTLFVLPDSGHYIHIQSPELVSQQIDRMFEKK